MDEEIRQRLGSKDLWIRALYMVFFAIVSVIARAVISLLALVQFIAILFTGRANEPLLQLGNNLSVYVAQIIRFVTFNTETQPFPFSPWPDEAMDENPWLEPEAATDVADTDDEVRAPVASSDDDDPDPGDTGGSARV
jgi:hypothetical protein